MERDDHKPPARFQHTFRRMQCAYEFAQFIVDENAQGLEYPCSRMDRHFRISADKRFNRIGKVARAGEWFGHSALVDHTGDAPRMAFLPEKIEDPRQITDFQAVDDISGT